jgi:glycine C-acetyltransferase
MRGAGFVLPATCTPIVPLPVGDERECARLAAALLAEDIHVDAIMFPAVAVGDARLRFMMNAGHTTADIDRVVETLRRAVRA